jgi:hypothetical protein
MVAFKAVPRADPYYGYLAANALQVLAAWRPSLLDVPMFVRRMADPLASHSDLRQLLFRVALLRWLQNVSRDLDKKHSRHTNPCRTMTC